MARKPRTPAELAAHIAVTGAAYRAAKVAEAAKEAADLAKAIAEGKPLPTPKPPRVFRHVLRGEELRHSPRGNGGPELDAPEPMVLTPRARALCRAGPLLYGRRWKAELAEDLGELPRQLRRWAAGEAQPDDAALRWTRRQVQARVEELQAILDDLADPAPPPPVPVDEPPPVPAAPPAPAGTGRVVDPRQVDLEAYIASLG